MEFRKYQHIERFGKSEVDGIEIGTCYVFPKIDGTNASAWLDDNGKIAGGSRRRDLTQVENDNHGFYTWLKEQENIIRFLEKFPKVTLYGEWLVPHTLKTYEDDAWRNFYVFDVVLEDGEHVPYDSYKHLLDDFEINYIPPIAIVENGTYETFIKLLERSNFLVKNGEGNGEGIVLKNYSFVNSYGRTTWAKIVTNEFQAQHSRTLGPPEQKGPDMTEMKIAEKYVTKSLCEKEHAKIVQHYETEWDKKMIPRIIETIFYCLITEEAWNFVKEFKNPRIDFKTLKYFTVINIKKHLPEFF